MSLKEDLLCKGLAIKIIRERYNENCVVSVIRYEVVEVKSAVEMLRLLVGH